MYVILVGDIVSCGYFVKVYDQSSVVICKFSYYFLYNQFIINVNTTLILLYSLIACTSFRLEIQCLVHK